MQREPSHRLCEHTGPSELMFRSSRAASSVRIVVQVCPVSNYIGWDGVTLVQLGWGVRTPVAGAEPLVRVCCFSLQ
jgi:hypothetical protein